jgi:exodeoxyribonuclease-3
MRLITWNINSLRLRMPLLGRLAAEFRPDVICLQETRVPDNLFPRDQIEALGYPHTVFRGMKGYNGVATISRLPLRNVQSLDWCSREDCRHVCATLPGGIELHNFYVPAGGDVPDPAINEKFGHKLRFLDEMAAWFGSNRRPEQAIILAGDLNVAPLETDVWSHRQLLKVVSHTPIEVDKLNSIRSTLDWVDGVRHFVPATERLYSWWSYRARDWAKSDRGRRLDHIWTTPALKARLASGSILREARGWERASDHVPVIVDIVE